MPRDSAALTHPLISMLLCTVSRKRVSKRRSRRRRKEERGRTKKTRRLTFHFTNAADVILRPLG